MTSEREERSQITRILERVQQQPEQPWHINTGSEAEAPHRNACREYPNARVAPRADQPTHRAQAEAFERQSQGWQPRRTEKRGVSNQRPFDQCSNCKQSNPADQNRTSRVEQAVM